MELYGRPTGNVILKNFKIVTFSPTEQTFQALHPLIDNRSWDTERIMSWHRHPLSELEVLHEPLSDRT